MPVDYKAKLIDAITDAKSHGWEVFKPNGVRRITEHETPEYAKRAGWWKGDTYESVEFLTFLGIGSGYAPKVVHGEHKTNWTSRRDQSISFKRALEILGGDHDADSR